MTDRQNITIGRVRQAYGLTAREGEMLIQAFWPDAVQPLELWRTTYESCWQAFIAGSHAAYGTQLPEFPSAPEPDTGIQTYLLGFDVMEFFRTISTVVPLNSLRYGLDERPPRTQREIAAQCGISRSYVSRIEKRALEKLGEAMEGWEP